MCTSLCNRLRYITLIHYKLIYLFLFILFSTQGRNWHSNSGGERTPRRADRRYPPTDQPASEQPTNQPEPLSQ